MELILSENVKSLTGSLGNGFGYSIRRRGKRFFAMKAPKGNVPPNGHLRFILACAELAQYGLHVTDISITAGEFKKAISEAKLMYGDALVKKSRRLKLNAEDVINYKKRYGL